jgi:hypothetical protein
MNPTSFGAAIQAVKGRDGDPPPPLQLRGFVWRSALLNLVIVLTALPVLAAAGGPGAILPAVTLLALLSALIWSLTFAAFFLVFLVRLFRRVSARVSGHSRRRPGAGSGLADAWLDGPG